MLSKTQLIYKYCSLNSAIKILKSGSVLLNAPSEFNDPFDSKFVIDEVTKNKTIDLIINYYAFKTLTDFVNSKCAKVNGLQKLLIKKTKDKINTYKTIIKVTKIYTPMPFFTDTIHKFAELNSKFSSNIKKATEKFENEFLTNIREIPTKARISCFSKRNDSILMWSHYATSHAGVCFEFKENRDYFKKVKYSKNRAVFDIYAITQKILANNFIDETFAYNKDDEIVRKALEPFFTKSLDWSYEKEIRCIFSSDDPKDDDYYWDEGKLFLRMQINKVYIGSKSEGKFLNEVLLLAKNRGIPVVFMKEDAKEFKIVPDISKHITPQRNPEKKMNSLEIIKEEITNCLNSNCYIAALSLALSVPSVFGQLSYPNMEPKDSYIKWFQENIGQYESDKRQIKDKMPYLSGELCYSLKNSIQNKCSSIVKSEYEDFRIDNLILKIENKNYFDIYGGESSIIPDSNGIQKSEIIVSIREICVKIIIFIDKFIENDNCKSIPSFSLRYFDKEIDKLKEIKILNNTLREKCKQKA